MLGIVKKVVRNWERGNACTPSSLTSLTMAVKLLLLSSSLTASRSSDNCQRIRSKYGIGSDVNWIPLPEVNSNRSDPPRAYQQTRVQVQPQIVGVDVADFPSPQSSHLLRSNGWVYAQHGGIVANLQLGHNLLHKMVLPPGTVVLLSQASAQFAILLMRLDQVDLKTLLWLHGQYAQKLCGCYTEHKGSFHWQVALKEDLTRFWSLYAVYACTGIVY